MILSSILKPVNLLFRAASTVLVGIFALVCASPAAAYEAIAQEVRGRVGTLGSVWGHSEQQVVRQGDTLRDESEAAGTWLRIYTLRLVPNAVSEIFGPEAVDWEYRVSVFSDVGLYGVVLVPESRFEVGAHAYFQYDAMKLSLTKLLGPPQASLEQNGTGIWEDKAFFECLSNLQFPEMDTLGPHECYFYSDWITDTGRMTLLIVPYAGRGRVMLWEKPDDEPRAKLRRMLIAPR